jgi:para-nitrobenzyl esterase
MKSLAFRSLLLSLAMVSAAGAADPVVSMTGGKIQGRLLSTPGGAVFKGIPFAAPPLGELRWREPAAVTPWNGVRDADAFGPSCVQEIVTWNNQEATGNQEDCLYLNVWTPEWPSQARNPVMVWIHGGGNTGGGASVDYFDGVSLSRRGVILVTINYRLGVFGFFAHPALTAESLHHSSGNYGMLDQVAALGWVHDNIQYFGGDPDNVTVFGQSAGGRDTGFLLASPLTKGLLRRAIQESGVPVSDIKTLSEAEQAGERLTASLQAPTGAAGIKFLRGMDAQQLLKSARVVRSDDGATAPVVDGWSMPISPAQAFATGKQHAVPLLIGSNAREQRGPQPEALRGAVTSAFGIYADKALAYYGLNVPGDGNSDLLYGSATTQFWADSRQRCGSVQEAIWHAAAKNPVYEYQFDRAIAGRPATQHSAELPYVFGNLLPGGFLGGPFTDADRKISDDIQIYWSNFARTGDPNGAGMPKWPTFDPVARAHLEFTDNGPTVQNNLRKEICDLFVENVQHQLNGH